MTIFFCGFGFHFSILRTSKQKHSTENLAHLPWEKSTFKLELPLILLIWDDFKMLIYGLFWHFLLMTRRFGVRWKKSEALFMNKYQKCFCKTRIITFSVLFWFEIYIIIFEICSRKVPQMFSNALQIFLSLTKCQKESINQHSKIIPNK